MITEKDLQEAIAECQGVRSPNANTCIKLAAFYILQDHLFGARQREDPGGYSFAPAAVSLPAETVAVAGESDFAQAVTGMDPAEAWGVMDELMDTLRVINPGLYRGVLRKLRG